jgi:iron(III) transport system substrate-binding protein
LTVSFANTTTHVLGGEETIINKKEALTMKGLRPQTVLCTLVVAFLLCPAISLSQSKPEPTLIEAAKKEGEITWYTSLILPHSQPLVARFEKKYPFINVKLSRVGGGNTLNKIFRETGGGLHAWDLATSRGEVYLPLRQRNLLAPYRSPEAAMFPDDMKDQEGYWTSLYVNPNVFGINTRMVKKEDRPRTYDDLLDPKWKDKQISIDKQSWGLLSGLSRAWGKDKTVVYLGKLAGQDPHIMRGHALRANLLAAGEFPLAIGYGGHFEEIMKQGGPVDWVPLEPVVINVYPIMLAARAPHPSAAKLFIDFVLSKEGQEMIRDFSRIPSRTDVSPLQPRLIQYRRVVENPEGFTDLAGTLKLFNEIFGLAR